MIDATCDLSSFYLDHNHKPPLLSVYMPKATGEGQGERPLEDRPLPDLQILERMILVDRSTSLSWGPSSRGTPSIKSK